jgi:hypothetical protein
MDDSKLAYYLDETESDLYNTKISGWMIVEGVPSWTLSLKLKLSSPVNTVFIVPETVRRNDVTAHVNQNKSRHHNYDNSGFRTMISNQSLPPDCYALSFVVTPKEKNGTSTEFKTSTQIIIR